MTIVTTLFQYAHYIPDHQALITPQGDYTYHQLVTGIQEDMSKLRAWGINAGDVVAILSNNHAEYVRLAFAVIGIGSILLPLNTRLAHDELGYQLRSTDAQCLIVSDELTTPTTDVPTLTFRQFHALTGRDGTPRSPAGQAPAVVMFTSGTSGKPKGAVLTHDNLIANAIATHQRLNMTDSDHWLCTLPLYHVGGLTILVRCFLLGAVVSLLPRFDINAVHHILCERNITLISLVPTMLYRLLDLDVTQWQKSLRLILLGGAAADAQLMRRCADHHLPVATTYGLTEASSQVCTATPDVAKRKPASVGKPMPGITVRIVDEHGKECPVGTIGEIAVRGKTVMRGYYQNPQATAKALRNEELFTGDMGYIDRDGDLWVVQRRSDLIITGGENVYPSEIETVLRGHPQVKDVAVIGIPDLEWGQMVACAVVGDVDIAELEKFARKKLAGYKIPRRWAKVDALPLNSMGKVEKVKLFNLFEGQK